MAVRRGATMNDSERSVMAEYGITCETRRVFHYKQYKYDRLDDALRFARADTGQAKSRSAPDR